MESIPGYESHRMPALMLIKLMDTKLYEFLTSDEQGIDDENNADLQTIVFHRWPWLTKWMIPHYAVASGVGEELLDEINIRKEQLMNGLISYKEFINAIAHEAAFAAERVKHIDI
jgi:hypothetical protein